MSRRTVPVGIPPRNEYMLATAKGKTFPVAVLKLKKKENPEKFYCELELEEKIYNHLVEHFGSDEIILYSSIELPLTTLGAYTPDMSLSHKFLEKFYAVADNITWVKEARSYIKKEISRL